MYRTWKEPEVPHGTKVDISDLAKIPVLRRLIADVENVEGKIIKGRGN